MEAWWILAGIAIVCSGPVILLRPLVVALANRINGKNVDSQQFKLMQKRLDSVEQQLAQMQHRLVTVEDSHDFDKRLIDGAAKPSPSNKDTN